MTEGIKDIRVIEYIDPEDETKSQWRLQVDYGDGWVNVEVKSTRDWFIFTELQRGME